MTSIVGDSLEFGHFFGFGAFDEAGFTAGVIFAFGVVVVDEPGSLPLCGGATGGGAGVGAATGAVAGVGAGGGDLQAKGAS